MYKPYDKLLDKITYTGCLIIAFLFIAYMASANILNINIDQYITPCILNTMTGFFCPGCGGTRAVKYLFSGHILKSLQYHPFVAYTILPGIWFLFTHSIYKIKKSFTNRNPFYKRNNTDNILKDRIKIILHPITVRPAYIYTGIALLLCQFLLKNILLLLNINILAYP